MGVSLELRMMLTNKLSCYTNSTDGSDGCRDHFVVHEYVAGENGSRLDGTTICITDVLKSDDENHSIWHLHHHNHGYTYVRVVNDNNCLLRLK